MQGRPIIQFDLAIAAPRRLSADAEGKTGIPLLVIEVFCAAFV
jgi:hypothetical protein